MLQIANHDLIPNDIFTHIYHYADTHTQTKVLLLNHSIHLILLESINHLKIFPTNHTSNEQILTLLSRYKNIKKIAFDLSFLKNLNQISLDLPIINCLNKTSKFFSLLFSNKKVKQIDDGELKMNLVKIEDGLKTVTSAIHYDLSLRLKKMTLKAEQKKISFLFVHYKFPIASTCS